MNTKEPITETSFKVLDIIAQGQELSQRKLATRSGLSLGMVNLVLKRLMRTGYIKVSNLSRKRMEYILTPKGFSERLTRSYHYFLRACHTFRESERRIGALLDLLVEKGNRRFIIIGEGEVAGIVEMALRSRPESFLDIRHTPMAPPQILPDEAVLDCRFHQNDGAVGISVLEEMLRFLPRKDESSGSMNGLMNGKGL